MVKIKELKKLFKKKKTPKGERKERKKVLKLTERRAKGTMKLLGAMGVTRVTNKVAKKKGAGRPRQTYKYGMPISAYKKQLSKQKALYSRYQQEQRLKLKGRGLTPEQINQLQQMRSIEERMPLQQPVRQSSRPQIQRQVKVSNRKSYPQPPPPVADDELRFKEWMAKKTVSPRTQAMLNEIRRIQNKGKSDNIEQQRRHWERRIVGASMNLMRAHENMNPIKLDFTGVDQETNILMAPSVFKEKSENNILRTNRGNILDTASYGNDLKF